MALEERFVVITAVAGIYILDMISKTVTRAQIGVPGAVEEIFAMA
jgi:hypothetical protein